MRIKSEVSIGQIVSTVMLMSMMGAGLWDFSAKFQAIQDQEVATQRQVRRIQEIVDQKVLRLEVPNGFVATPQANALPTTVRDPR